MARPEETWLKNYEDVEFDVPGLGDERPGSRSPTESAPMLPPKTHAKDGVILPREGQPHIAGIKSLPHQHPTLAPPGTINPIARIPRSHSAPKALPNSPLNPSSSPTPTTTTTTSASMPFPSPFAQHTRPGSRSSAYFSRIASEEARAFGTNNNNPPSNLPSANPGLTSRGSMILYRVADPFSPSTNNSGTNTPTSHYSLKGLVAADDGSLPLPDPNPPSRNNHSHNRFSIYSTSGDSIVSLSSDSKYPNLESQRSGLIAYVYDPDADDCLDDDEEVDWLHDPEILIAEKLANLRNRPTTTNPPQRPSYVRPPPKESPLSWRGFLNISMLILLVVTILALFIAYPTVATINDGGKNRLIAFNTRINSSGQAVEADFDPAAGGTSTSTSSSATIPLQTETDSTTSSTSTTRHTTTTTTPTTTTATTRRTTTTTTSTDDSTATADSSSLTKRGFKWDVERKLWVIDEDDSDAEGTEGGWVEKDPWARRSSRDFKP